MNEFEKTTLKMRSTTMKRLRNIKARLQFEGFYASHELIVDYLVRKVRVADLMEYFKTVKPTPRGPATKAHSRKR